MITVFAMGRHSFPTCRIEIENILSPFTGQFLPASALPQMSCTLSLHIFVLFLSVNWKKQGRIPEGGAVQIIFSDVEEVNGTMPKQNKQAGMNQAKNAQTAQNTATEFASETNVSEVRRQNQQSAAKSGQQAGQATE
jgi:small acid-soluble spore protein E (minor gamma-type SASP)